MNTYKLCPLNPFTGKQDSVWLLDADGQTILGIPFDPANTDYQAFKVQILAEEAELEDADGNMMTPEEAKSYVETLP